MYLLGLGLLILSTWYLLRLFDSFNNDPLAQKELDQAWQAAKDQAKGKNPFVSGRIKAAIDSYKTSMKNKSQIK